MRHVKRAHGVRLSFLTDEFKKGTFALCDCNTTAMAADIFTKHFINMMKWHHAIELIGMCKAHKLPGAAKARKVSGGSAAPALPCVPLPKRRVYLPSALKSADKADKNANIDGTIILVENVHLVGAP